MKKQLSFFKPDLKSGLQALSFLIFLSAGSNAQTTITRTISAGSDDMEEYTSTGAVVNASSDLELITETSAQRIGLRFTNITIPQGATISNAYIQFTCDETSSGTTSLTFKGQAADNAATFTTSANTVGSRPVTTASVSWNPSAWNTLQQRAAAQQSPELKTIIQEIVNRSGWSSGNALAIVITGSGVRIAESYEGANSGSSGHAPNQAPTLVITHNGSAPPSSGHISEFTSITPGAQTGQLTIPSSHKFQMLFKAGSTYTSGGTVPAGHDFTGYVPISGSSTNGYVSVNHENSPGSLSILDVNYNTSTKLWEAPQKRPVTFNSSEVVKTERNCSGGVTSWGTIITAEETRNTGDVNGDGYTDTGWLVEIDPATRTVKQYGNGKTEKLWAMGRMSHENAVVAADNKTVYYGEDDPSGCVYKFVANTAGNLYTGTLYVLKLAAALSGGEPTSSTGNWVAVPNTTQSDRNNTYSLATSLAATAFNGVEDVEIASDGKVYFTSKGNGRVYRFTDNGTSVSGFQTYAGGMNYSVTHSGGTTSVAWGTGNDNLAFDDLGNLWVQQDGGNNYIWVVEPSHTQASPKVKLFGRAPAGAETTGLTFTPDKKYMFLSIQHPSTSNGSQTDASGTSVSFNNAATIVIATSANLGTGGARTGSINDETSADIMSLSAFPNPFDDHMTVTFNSETDGLYEMSVTDINGKSIYSNKINASQGVNTFEINMKEYEKGAYILRITGYNTDVTRHIIKK